MTLYFANPSANCALRRAEIERAIADVIADNRYILGGQVASFEERFAAFCEVPHAVGVANGTDALKIALLAADIGAGDEVVTVAHTAVATASAIAQVGAVPVFVDTVAGEYTMDPDTLAAAVTPKTRAVVLVHLFGQPANLDPILELTKDRDLTVIEDCAQAHGAGYKGRRVGSMGDFGTFSFYPTKNLAAIGDGGAVVTRDAGLAQRMRQLREYGWDGERVSQSVGMNSRLDEIQAAILNVQLTYLEEETERRIAIAGRYGAGLAGLPIDLPATRADCRHVFHLYVIALDERDAMKEHLAAADIIAGIHYPVPVHLQPPYMSDRINGLPVTERAARRILSLPMYPALTDEEVDHVIGAVRSFY